MDKRTKNVTQELKQCMMVCKRKGSSSGFTWLLADIHTLLQNALHTVLTFSDPLIEVDFGMHENEMQNRAGLI